LSTIVADIPERFWRVTYDPAHDPNSPVLLPIASGANCQNFAYELLKRFGRHVPLFRSSNLWEDSEHTMVVSGPEPLDLLLFNRTNDPWGAHVALHVGDGQAIHLAKKLGSPAVWSIEKFGEQAEYRVFIGAKRARR
jgi:lipoprotein Spr